MISGIIAAIISAIVTLNIGNAQITSREELARDEIDPIIIEALIRDNADTCKILKIITSYSDQKGKEFWRNFQRDMKFEEDCELGL